MAGAASSTALRFLPFLPLDNTLLKDDGSEAAVAQINQDLGAALALGPAEFWDLLRGDPSLAACIDSYLRFKRRLHDLEQDSVQGTSPAQQQLARRVFMVLLRMVTVEKTGPPAMERARLLRDARLLDVPQLLDVCALYGPTNTQLTQRLVKEAFALQPRLYRDLREASHLLAHNLQELEVKCREPCAAAMRGETAAAANLADVLSYLHDAAATLSSLAAVHPPAAAALLASAADAGDAGGSSDGAAAPSLLAAVASVHDRLAPAMAAALRQPPAAATAAAAVAAARVPQLQARLELLACQLLQSAFLVEPPPSPSSSASPSSSSSSAPHHLNPEQRGTDMMSLVMTVSDPSAEGAAPSPSGAAGRGRAGAQEQHLLVAANARFRLDVSVARALRQGVILLDDAQYDYLMALIGGDRGVAEAELDRLQQLQRQQQGGASASSSALAAGSSSSSGAAGGVKIDVLIAAVRDVLPDYGTGFLTACLWHYDMKPEQVINHLLEGNLHADLQKLDPQLAVWSPPGMAAGDPKGKGKMGAIEEGLPSSWASASTQAAAWGQASAAAAAAAASSVPVPSSSARPRPGMHLGVARVLGKLDPTVKAATQGLAEELQWEYEDEYDDSFDGLQSTGADGVCDVEGDGGAADDRRRRFGALGQDAGSGPGSGTEGPNARGFAGLGGQGQGLRRGDAGQGARAPGAAGPSSRPGPGAVGGRGQGPAGGRGGAPSGGRGATSGAGKLWVLDGRIYNYAKEGAQAVTGREEAERALDAARQAAQAIMGLGPGGNVPLPPQRPPGRQQQQQDGGDDGEDEGSEQEAGFGGQGRGRGRGGAAPGFGGRGRGRGGEGGAGTGPGGPNYDRKEKNKAAVANHHRKDRAMRKMGL